MKYSMKNKMKVVVLSVITMITAVGCSTTSKYSVLNDVVVERVNSMDAKIIRANLYSHEVKNVVLRGDLKRQFYIRNAQIPGQLRIELFNLKGEIFKEFEFDYGRKVNNLSKLSFSVPIQVEPGLISKVRVIHH